jgi:hypothetical protein
MAIVSGVFVGGVAGDVVVAPATRGWRLVVIASIGGYSAASYGVGVASVPAWVPLLMVQVMVLVGDRLFLFLM